MPLDNPRRLLQVTIGVLLVVTNAYGHDNITWDEQFNFWRNSVWRQYTSMHEQLHPFDNATCYQQVDTYFKALESYQGWAVQVSDSNGRYTSGLYSGNGYWLGSRPVCQEVDNRFIDQLMTNSTVEDTMAPPFRVAFFVLHLYYNVTSGTSGTRRKVFNVKLGLCLPRSCAKANLPQLVQQMNTILQPEAVPPPQVLMIRFVSREYSFWQDSIFKALLIATVIIGTLMLTGSLYDIMLHKNTKQKNFKRSEFNNNSAMDKEKMSSIMLELINKTNMNINGSKTNHSINNNIKNTISTNGNSRAEYLSTAEQILLAFSVPTNVKKVCSLDVGEDTLASIHGLRVFSMLWVLLIHTCLLGFEVADNKVYREKAEEDFLYRTLSSGAYSVDTFFVLSGCLVTFLYYRTSAKYGLNETLRTDGHWARQIFLFLKMVFYRFIRLTPPYIVVLGVVVVSMKYFQDNAALELPSQDHINCPTYWWRNVLYINTLFPLRERCMIWSWYLADDTQFYIIGIILLIFSVRYFRVAAASTVVFLVTSWVTTAAVSLSHDHVPTVQEPFAHYDALYEKPWIRIGPYLLGMWAGWFLASSKCSLQLSKKCVWLCWLAAVTSMLVIIFGLHFVSLNPLSAAFYVALSHSMWAGGVAWIIVACSTGNGGWLNEVLSWRFLYPASRITYCVYLLHPQIMRNVVLAYDSPTHIARDFMWVLYFGFVVASYMVAFLVSLTFEAPCVALLRLMHPMRHKDTTNSAT